MSDLVTSPAVVDFYNLMRDRISEQDIREFSPADPGYYDYVRVWSEIVSTGHVPNSWVWDLHEVISLTFGDLPGKVSDDPDRYRVYRLFLSSVEFHLWLTDGIGGSVLNYSAINLIDDSRDLNDPEILSLVTLPP